MSKGLAECDKCDYFLSVEEAYKQGRADEQLQSIEDTKQRATEYLDLLDMAKEESYQRGKTDGAREFAEWLSDSKYTYIEVGDIGFYTDDHQIHWRPIDKVLAEWQKGVDEQKTEEVCDERESE